MTTHSTPGNRHLKPVPASLHRCFPLSACTPKCIYSVLPLHPTHEASKERRDLFQVHCCHTTDLIPCSLPFFDYIILYFMDLCSFFSKTSSSDFNTSIPTKAELSSERPTLYHLPTLGTYSSRVSETYTSLFSPHITLLVATRRASDAP